MIWIEELQTRKKLSRIFSAYESTFPEDERREKDQVLLLIENPDCLIFAVKNDDEFVGYLILWKLEDFYLGLFLSFTVMCEVHYRQITIQRPS